MPLRLEEINNRPMWVLVCDRCAFEGQHLNTINEAYEEASWHLSNDEVTSELEPVAVLCDVCSHLQRDERLSVVHYGVRDALIDGLRLLPGGQP